MKVNYVNLQDVFSWDENLNLTSPDSPKSEKFSQLNFKKYEIKIY